MERFSRLRPKLFLTVDGLKYAGATFDRVGTTNEIRRSVPSIENIIVVPFLHPGAAKHLPQSLLWGDLLMRGSGAELQFEQLPFEHPLWILGAAGASHSPNLVVHSQGGILIEHLKTLHFHLDLGPGDRFFWATSPGSMMWNMLVSGLLTGAAIVLYDGSSKYPDLEILWDFAVAADVTCFGTSSAYIASCIQAGLKPANGRDLSRLRSAGTNGPTLPPESVRWLHERAIDDRWIFSLSGETEVCTALVGGVPTLPVYEGELQARALGAKVEAYDANGRSVIGSPGELVLTQPLPSLPLFLWGDDGTRYRESYLSAYPGVWHQGDSIEITPRGTAMVRRKRG